VSISATQMKVGMIIMHNGKPHRVTNVLHVTPGNWRGMVQTRMVNIETGSNAEHRFRSEDRVDQAAMEHHQLQFSYRAGDEYHFMNVETYEMMSLHEDVLGVTRYYLMDGMQIEALYFEGRVVGIEVPNFIELTVTETQPAMRGATAAASPKPAKLQTGLEIRVPQYIEVGDKIRIDTRTDEFIERA
jgi:elongation factor P